MEQRKQQTQATEAILAPMERCPGARLAMPEAYDALVRAGRAIGTQRKAGVARRRGQA